MSLFGNIKDNIEQKKKENEVQIKKWNEHIRHCANKNRIAQIKHLEEYLEFPSIQSDDTIVLAKLFCERTWVGDNYQKHISVIFYNKDGEDIYWNNATFPIKKEELYRVVFKIIPFVIVSSDGPEWWIHDFKWNYGSDYDVNKDYKGKVPFFSIVSLEGEDDTIKSETDVFVKRDELKHLEDGSLLYLYDIIKSWKENNFSEIVGDYKLWKEKRDFILSYEKLIMPEIYKRNLTKYISKENDIKDNFGEKGELSIDYALKWLPKEYSIIEKNQIKKIFLRDVRVSDEKQEFDHIAVGPNGVFSIETKYFKGNIKIDSNGNWSREVEDGKIEGIKNPIQQVDRHHMVIASILSGVVEEKDIHDIICLAYDTCTVEGIENSEIPIVKGDIITRHITKTVSSKKYSGDDIKKIVATIEKYRITK